MRARRPMGLRPTRDAAALAKPSRSRAMTEFRNVTPILQEFVRCLVALTFKGRSTI